ncbi:MAG TPA: AraC family transcriptional regulator [Trinickia sp.]|nr:AraC family transcriptional regulator [Trinickia sp.]
MTLLLSTTGRAFQLRMRAAANTTCIDATAVLVAPKQARSIRAEHCNLLSVNVEPGHPRYHALQDRLQGAAAVVFDDLHFSGLRDELGSLFNVGLASPLAAPAIDAALEAASGSALKHTPRDDRVADVLACVHASLPERPTLQRLGSMVGLSEDRLSHLFADTIGMPLRSYVVWQRYRLALEQISRAERLTTLASRCGFSDAAHMTRTFVEFFGFSPSLVLRSGFMQYLAPPE